MITYKIGDTHPPVEAELTDADGTVSLDGIQKVQFVMRRVGSKTTFLTEEAEIVSASDGAVKYQPQEDDFSEKGSFNAEWIVTWGDGTESTFPNDAYELIQIKERL